MASSSSILTTVYTRLPGQSHEEEEPLHPRQEERQEGQQDQEGHEEGALAVEKRQRAEGIQEGGIECRRRPLLHKKPLPLHGLLENQGTIDGKRRRNVCSAFPRFAGRFEPIVGK